MPPIVLAPRQFACDQSRIHRRHLRHPIVAALAQVVFPRLLERRPPDLPIRVWVPACSSGEEPYTLAMVLDRTLAKYDVDWRVLATDISTAMLERAAHHGGVAAARAIPAASIRAARYSACGCVVISASICQAERSEASPAREREILRFAGAALRMTI